MNRVAIAVAIVVASMQFGWACPKGSVEWKGNCAAMPRSIGPEPTEMAKWVSDEKPPKDKMPSYQREGVHAVDLKPENPADEHHPKDCPVGCKWDGGTCSCGDKGGALTVSDAGKKPE